MSDFNSIAEAGDHLEAVNQEAIKMAAVNDGLEKGYAHLGWMLLETSEMQYWRVLYNTFNDYVDSVAKIAKKTRNQLQRYMLTVRDLSNVFTPEQLERIGITKAMRLRTIKEYAIVLPQLVIDAALNSEVTAAELKSLSAKAIKFPEDDTADWMDCGFEFIVNAEEHATIEAGILAARRADPITKSDIDESAQMKDVMMKLCQEFLGAHPSEQQ